MVDEYQDTNSVQYLWLRLLAQERKNICCVGDDDQSIYSLARRAGREYPEVRKGFPRREGHPARTELPLHPAHPRRRIGRHRQQWRPPRQDAVDRARPRARRSRSSASGTAPRKRAASARRSRACSAAGAALDDVAILVRAQYQTREFEDRFIAIGLPYRIVGGFRFYERAEIRDALAYLRVVAPARRRPRLRTHRQRPQARPRRQGGRQGPPARPRRGHPAHHRRRAHPRHRRADPPGAPRARQSRRRHRPLARPWASALPHPELARIILDESGYTAMLQADRTAEAAGRLENLNELVRAMEEYETLGAFLEHVSLVMDNERSGRRAQGHDHDHPRRQGPGIRHGVPRRLGRRRLPLAARARRRRPRLPGGGTPPRLCRDHPRAPPRHHPPRRQPPHLRPVDQLASPAASSPNCPRSISTAKPP